MSSAEGRSAAEKERARASDSGSHESSGLSGEGLLSGRGNREVERVAIFLFFEEDVLAASCECSSGGPLGTGSLGEAGEAGGGMDEEGGRWCLPVASTCTENYREGATRESLSGSGVHRWGCGMGVQWGVWMKMMMDEWWRPCKTGVVV